MATNSGLTPGGASYPLLTDAPHPDNIKEPVVELDQRAPVVATDVAALNSILDSGNRTDRLGFLTNTRELVAWDGSNWISIGSLELAKFANAQNTTVVSTTSPATLATNIAVTLNLPVATDVKIDFGFNSMSASSGDVRAGVEISGATTKAANSDLSLEVLCASPSFAPGQSAFSFPCNAGTNTFTLKVWRNGSGTCHVRYPRLHVEAKKLTA